MPGSLAAGEMKKKMASVSDFRTLSCSNGFSYWDDFDHRNSAIQYETTFGKQQKNVSPVMFAVQILG